MGKYVKELRTALSNIRQMREWVPHLGGTPRRRHSRPRPRPLLLLLRASPVLPRALLALPLHAPLNDIRLLRRLALQSSLRQAKQTSCSARNTVARAWACRGGREARETAHGRQRSLCGPGGRSRRQGQRRSATDDAARARTAAIGHRRGAAHAVRAHQRGR